ncbi:cytochrome c oxidase subunit 1 [Rhizoclosmatium sp. JEL0117]|nr:cytochrome c oxidase subunit 1 [Rhizoclosmatium sp. JEL0117]
MSTSVVSSNPQGSSVDTTDHGSATKAFQNHEIGKATSIDTEVQCNQVVKDIAIAWAAEILDEIATGQKQGSKKTLSVQERVDLLNNMRSGIECCKIMNLIQPGLVPSIVEGVHQTATTATDNLASFALGVPNDDEGLTIYGVPQRHVFRPLEFLQANPKGDETFLKNLVQLAVLAHEHGFPSPPSFDLAAAKTALDALPPVPISRPGSRPSSRPASKTASSYSLTNTTNESPPPLPTSTILRKETTPPSIPKSQSPTTISKPSFQLDPQNPSDVILTKLDTITETLTTTLTSTNTRLTKVQASSYALSESLLKNLEVLNRRLTHIENIQKQILETRQRGVSQGDESGEGVKSPVKLYPKLPAEIAGAGLPKAELMRLSVIYELIETEADYIRDLGIMIDLHKHEMSASKILDDITIDAIFSNVDELIAANSGLLDKLNAKREQNAIIEVVSDAFIESNDIWVEAYTTYCSNYPLAMKIVTKLGVDEKFGELMKQFVEDPTSRGLSLESFLIKPIQRICKYPLLLRELMKHTPKTMADYPELEKALEKMESLATRVNEASQALEKKERLASLLSRIESSTPLPFHEKKLIIEGLTQMNKGKERHLLLLKDVLVVSKVIAKGRYAMENVFPMYELVFVKANVHAADSILRNGTRTTVHLQHMLDRRDITFTFDEASFQKWNDAFQACINDPEMVLKRRIEPVVSPSIGSNLATAASPDSPNPSLRDIGKSGSGVFKMSGMLPSAFGMRTMSSGKQLVSAESQASMVVLSPESSMREPSLIHASRSDMEINLPDVVEINGQVWRKSQSAKNMSYYYNPITKESMWRLPKEYMPMSEVSARKHLSQQLSTNSLQIPMSTRGSMQTENVELEVEVVAGHPEWRYVSKGVEHPYYYHSATNESIAADAVRLPSVFVRAVASPAQCAPLLAGLLQIMHDVDPDSRIMAHALQLALLLFKDKELRRLFLDMGSFDVLAAKVPLLRENLSLVLQFIEAATRITILPTCNESNALIVFLQNNILSSSSPSLSVLAIIANACKNNDIAKHLNSLPHSERFVRHILAYLSDPDINFLTIVHSLQILVRLTVDDPMGQKFFKESNIDQIWRLLFSMMEKGSSYSLEPVLDLLEETMSIAKFRTSLENYVANTAYIKQALIDLHSNSQSHAVLFRCVSILLDAEIAVIPIMDCVLELDMIPLAFRHLSDIVKGDSNKGALDRFPDGGDGLEFSCAFLRAMLALAQDSTRLPADPLRQLHLQFGLSIRLIFRAIVDSFNKDKIDPESSLSPSSLLDAIQLCDHVISCTQLKLRPDNLATVKLDRLVYFLAGFCNESRQSTDAGVYGVEMVVAVLHLCIVASEVKKEELPSDVIDSNAIKYIIAEEIGGRATHAHVVACCLNLVAQCPSRDFFVEAFVEINNKAKTLKRMSGVGRGLGLVGSGVRESLKGRESISRLHIEQMSDSLAELDIDDDDIGIGRPSAMEQLDEAERSLQVLTQLEKEVGNIAERMKKEMELKEAISERKIAAHESKSQLLKAEVTELRELLDEKVVIIRQLEASQSEAFRKNSEYNTMIVSHESEKRRLREDLDNSRMLYRESKEKSEELEKQLKEKTKLLSEKSHQLEESRSTLANLTERFDDLEKVLEATTVDRETQVKEFRDRLSVKEELETKLLHEVKTLRAQLATITEEKEKLAEMVEKYRDEEREHEDLVSRLAQLATIANKKK